MKHKFRTQYDSTDGIDPGITCTLEERRTQSEFAEDCDINILVARYRKTGMLPDTSQRAAQALYGDFSQIPSRMAMFDMVENAWDAFNALPPEVRREFNNDASEFLAATDTPEGVALLKKLGLGKPEDLDSNNAAAAANALLAANPPASGGQPDPETPPKKVKNS